jgi:hypothetical protein
MDWKNWQNSFPEKFKMSLSAFYPLCRLTKKLLKINSRIEIMDKPWNPRTYKRKEMALKQLYGRSVNDESYPIQGEDREGEVDSYRVDGTEEIGGLGEPKEHPTGETCK